MERERDVRIAGSAYFIVDVSPVENFLVFMEPAAALLRPFYRMTPVLNRSSVRFVCQDHTFDGDRARQELGYKPIYAYPEALQRTIDWLREWLQGQDELSR